MNYELAIQSKVLRLFHSFDLPGTFETNLSIEMMEIDTEL